MNLKLPFGLKDGKLVEISEVERGLNCTVPVRAVAASW